MSLVTLPTELHLELLSTLDYQSLMNVTATNHYFASLRTKDLVRKALRHLERSLMQEWATRFGFATVYDQLGFHEPELARLVKLHDLPPQFQAVLPCYDCLKLRERASHFSLFFMTGDSDLDGILASGRKCRDCMAVRRWRTGWVNCF